MNDEHSPFPSNENLTAFIDGKLDKATRLRVMEHMASCAECLDVLLVANELKPPNRTAESWARRLLKRCRFFR
jgi:anti-sigma factor ChrR (cupin superfamily)